MEGSNYTEVDTVRIYKETLDRFMKDYPDFIGSKLIYAPIRNADDGSFDHYIKVCLEIKVSFRNLICINILNFIYLLAKISRFRGWF